MVKKLKIGQSAAKYPYKTKDRGSTTTISNPIYGDAEYKNLCYLED